MLCLMLRGNRAPAAWRSAQPASNCPVLRTDGDKAACCLAVCIGAGRLLAGMIDMLSEAQLTLGKDALAQLPLDCLHWLISDADRRH